MAPFPDSSPPCPSKESVFGTKFCESISDGAFLIGWRSFSWKGSVGMEGTTVWH